MDVAGVREDGYGPEDAAGTSPFRRKGGGEGATVRPSI